MLLDRGGSSHGPMVIEELVDDGATSSCSNYIEIMDDQEGSNQSFRSPYTKRSKKEGFGAIEARMNRLEQMFNGINSKID